MELLEFLQSKDFAVQKLSAEEYQTLQGHLLEYLRTKNPEETQRHMQLIDLRDYLETYGIKASGVGVADAAIKLMQSMTESKALLKMQVFKVYVITLINDQQVLCRYSHDTTHTGESGELQLHNFVSLYDFGDSFKSPAAVAVPEVKDIRKASIIEVRHLSRYEESIS